jgi:hypothetical protein
LDYSLTYNLLVQIRDAATSCLSVPYCAYIWPGADPPISCSEGLSVAINADFNTRVDGCDYLEYMDVTISVDICQGQPDDADSATEISCSFYERISQIMNGLHQWHHDSRQCESIMAGGFRFSHVSDEGCVRYVSEWTVRLSQV